MKLAGFLDVATDPAAPALVAPGCTWSHADVAAAVADRAHALACRGVSRGRRLLVLHDHDEEAIFLLAAASAMGLRLVMPYSLQEAAPGEWAAMLGAVRPDHVVDLRAGRGAPVLPAGTGCVITREALLGHPPAPRREVLVIEAPDPVEDFLTLFSSGTTGAPKAICIPEALVCLRVGSVSARLGFDAAARVFMTGLLNNTTGILFSFGALAHGATLFLPRTRDVARWPAQVEAQRLTHMMLRPAVLRRFLAGTERRTDLTSLRTVAYGAAAMPRPLLEAARRRMPCAWVQGYGLSETFGPFCWMDEADHRDDLHRAQVHCVGRPDDTLEVRIDAGAPGEVGEVLLRGRALMRGYLDVTTGLPIPPDEWFRTGDHGLFTPEGQLVLKGRSSATLLTGAGHRIYPEEVEGALGEVAGVTESLLLALPGDGPVDVPIGCIHGPLAGEDAGTIGASVAGALVGTLAREKWPAFLFASRDPFPRNRNDKIDRRALAGALASAPLIALPGGE